MTETYTNIHETQNEEGQKVFVLVSEHVTNITEENITDIIITALEGGIDYWGYFDRVIVDRPLAFEDMSESEYAASVLLSGYKIAISEVEEAKEYILTLENLLEGIRLNYLDRPWDSDLDNMDAITADCIIQYALFREIVFG